MNYILRKRVSPLICLFVVLFFMFCVAPSASAQGGPPMLTDDPGTPGNRMWEVNFLSSVETARGKKVFKTPNVDLNYGLGDHLQIKFELPWLVMTGNGNAIGGAGNSLVGVKWRFLDQERGGFDVSTYPQLGFNNPTSSVTRGLVEKELTLFLPVEVVRKVGPFEVNGEIGYRIVRQSTDEMEYGLALGRQITKRIELLGELHGSALRNMKEDELFFNVGSRLMLNKNAVLLLSAGRTVRAGGEPAHYIAAFGIQINFETKALRALMGRRQER